MEFETIVVTEQDHKLVPNVIALEASKNTKDGEDPNLGRASGTIEHEIENGKTIYLLFQSGGIDIGIASFIKKDSKPDDKIIFHILQDLYLTPERTAEDYISILKKLPDILSIHYNSHGLYHNNHFCVTYNLSKLQSRLALYMFAIHQYPFINPDEILTILSGAGFEKAESDKYGSTQYVLGEE